MLKLFEKMNEFHFHILRMLLLISVLALSIGLEHSQHLLAVIPITLVIFILLIGNLVIGHCNINSLKNEHEF